MYGERGIRPAWIAEPVACLLPSGSQSSSQHDSVRTNGRSTHSYKRHPAERSPRCGLFISFVLFALSVFSVPPCLEFHLNPDLHHALWRDAEERCGADRVSRGDYEEALAP